MSGGSLNYFYSYLEEHIGDFGDKELDDLIKDLVKLFHDREWFLSSDTNEGTWNEARDTFKEKWFSAHGRQKRIEKYLEEVKEEVFKSFGISEKYCKNCHHWEPDSREDYSSYGHCPFQKNMLMHKYESCDKFNSSCTDYRGDKH